MKRFKFYLLLFCMLAGFTASIASAQYATGNGLNQQANVPLNGQMLKAIVVGDDLNWERNEFNLTMVVTQKADVAVSVYSPGFDPNDYRADWQGGVELGDERYDQGLGQVSSEFSLNSSGRPLANKSYGVEDHRTDTLYRGSLEPGEYVINSKFFGKGKNSFIYGFESYPASAVQLYVEAFEPIVDPNLTNYNIARGDWQVPFSINNTTGQTAYIGIYDGDGPNELQFRLTDPFGIDTDEPVSGDLHWLDYTLGQGNWGFAFRVPDSAYQYTNTIGLRSSCRMRVDGTNFTCVAGANFEVTVNADKAAACDGDNLGYTVSVTNTGGSWGMATLMQPVPRGLTSTPLNERVGLFAGETKSFTMAGPISDVVAAGMTQIVANATVSGRFGSVSSSAVTAVECAPPAAFTVSKEVDRTQVTVGDAVNYTIRVSNVGGSAGSFTLIDRLPTGLIGDSIEQEHTLEAGQSEFWTVNAYADASALGGFEVGQVNNCAEVWSGGSPITDCVVVNVSQPAPPPPPPAPPVVVAPPAPPAPPPPAPPAYTMTKTVDQSQVTVGGAVSYTITVTNVGGSMGHFKLLDKLPYGLIGDGIHLTYDLAPGQSDYWIINAQVDQNAPNRIENCVELWSNAGDITECVSFDVVRPVAAPPPPPPPPPPAPLGPPVFSLSKTADKSTIVTSENVRFTISVSNTGETTGRFTIRDYLPTGLTGNALEQSYDLAAGQTQMWTVDAVASGQVYDYIENCAELISDYGTYRDCASVYVAAPEPVYVPPPAPVYIPGPAEFRLSKVADYSEVDAGDLVTYTITVSNIGESAGTFTLIDRLPVGLIGEGFEQTYELAAGQTEYWKLSASVDASAPSEINNCAELWFEGSSLQDCIVVTLRPPPPPLGPAAFTLDKEVSHVNTNVGDPLRYSITVSNIGQSAGTFELVDTLPTGLTGEGLHQIQTLAAGESTQFLIDAVVNQDAPDSIENCAVLTSDVGNVQDCALISVTHPFDPTKLILVKEVKPAFTEVGNTVIFTLVAKNDSTKARTFVIEDYLPEYLAGNNLIEEFVLDAGSSRTFVLSAIVLEGAPKEITNYASLNSEGQTAISSAVVHVIEPVVEPEVIIEPVIEPVEPVIEVEPVVLAPAAFSIAKQAMQETVEVGKPASFLITVNNTGGTEGTVTLADVLPGGLTGTSINEVFTLPAGEKRLFPLTALVDESAPDVIVNRACITSDAGEQCATANITVMRPVVVAPPTFTQERYSDISLEFNSEGHAEWVDRVLITHWVPAGSTYIPGSSTFNGDPIGDPTFVEGRLYWVLGMIHGGEIRYRVRHEGALAPVEEPTFTLRTAVGENMVAGSASFNVLPGLGISVDDPTFPMQKIGDMNVVGYQLNVGNYQPIEIGLELPENLIGAYDYVTIASNLGIMDPDGRTDITGHQVTFDAAGKAKLRFEPKATVNNLNLEVLYGSTQRSVSLGLLGAREGIFTYHVGAKVILLGGDLGADVFARGYLEYPIGPGTLQAAIDVGLNPLNFVFDTDRGLSRVVSSDPRFILTGSGLEAGPALRSNDGIAIRYDTPDVTVGYYAASEPIPGQGSSPDITAARLQTRGPLKVGAYAGLTASGPQTITFDNKPPHLLNGSKIYSIGNGIAVGKEKLTLNTDGVAKVLTRLTDYTIDYPTGLITLKDPLWPTDPTSQKAVNLVVEYEPIASNRDQLVYGVGASYTAGTFTFGAGLSNLGSGINIGAEAGFYPENFSVVATYRGQLIDGVGKNNILTVVGNGGNETVGANVNLTLTDTSLLITGTGRLHYTLGWDGGVVALEHIGNIDVNQSSAIYEQSFGPFGIGAGLGYTWEKQIINGILRGFYSKDNLTVNLTHNQPFDTGAQARSDLSVVYDVDENLSINSLVYYVWGQTLAGAIGLDQKVGTGNVSFDYSLPTISGLGNKANLTVDVPFNINESTSFTVTGKYDYDFNNNSGEAVLASALRYQGTGISGILGGEIGLPQSGDMRFSINAGLYGQLDANQTVTFDNVYQIMPTVSGKTSLSYALKQKRLNLLTTHSFVTNEFYTELAGELAPTYDLGAGFELRPSAAYRISFSDPTANIFELKLGGIYYVDTAINIGLGAFGHYAMLPNLGTSDVAASVEFRAQLLEELWLTLGYSLGGYDGLLLNGAGPYLSLDIIGGNQF